MPRPTPPTPTPTPAASASELAAPAADGVVEEVFRPQNVYPSPSYAANYRRPVTPESFTGETYSLGWKNGYYKGVVWNTLILIVQELCESRGGRPGLSVLTSLLVSVDVKQY